ncbi:neuromedin-U receptor 2-like [Saccostrea echinata]|uniref:neuromedin-U receptor 2-like n=1 Tax=Saccostrea echinata TaxID=191078 RepID=UPI002A831006|nr:neuromedin-U receptor 2-like [Saccostrea echinata]
MFLNMNSTQLYTLEDWNYEKSKVLTVNTVILGFYLLIGVVGNSIVIYVYNFRMKGPRDDRYFIPHLAVMDLCACIVGVGYAMALNIIPLRFQGDELCKILWFASQATTMCAAFMLLVIAIQRYLKVVRPFKKQMTIKTKHFALVAIILLSIVLSLPCFMFYGEITIINSQLNLKGSRCGASPNSDRTALFLYNTILFVIVVGGLITISVLYIMIGRTIYRQHKYRRRISSATSAVKRSNRDSMEWNPPSESGGGVPPRNKPQRDSLDFDSPFLDSLTEAPPSPVTPVNEESSPLQNSTFLSVPMTTTEKIRSSFTEIQKKAFNSAIPTVRKHFGTHRCSWMFMLIAVVFVLSFIPRITLNVLESVDHHFWHKLTDREIAFYLFLYRFYLVNNISNPFFYGLFDRALRKELRKICCCRYGK